MHRLLERQAQRAFGAADRIPEGLAPFLALISAAYDDADRDRELVEHTLETMSQELCARNERLASELVERKGLEAELRRQALVLGALSEGVLMTTGTGRILDANPAAERTLGLSRDRLLASGLDEVLRGLSGSLDLRSISSTLARDGRWHGDLRGPMTDGTEGVFETVIVPVEGARAGTCWAAVLRDVTSRLLLEQQLFQAQKLEAIGSLAAGVAHEINTPSQYVADNLTFLQDAFSTWAASDATPEGIETRAQLMEEIPSAIEHALEGMHHIAKIVRSIKRFAHPGGGSRAPIDLNGEIESAVTVSRNEWKYSSEVELDLAEDLPDVACYPGEIGQVVLNILINAAHAIVQGRGDESVTGHIRISTRRHGDDVIVSIADDGSGIPESVQARVFDPFFTTKPVGKGTGQGLAICHRLVVEKHGGGLTFETREGLGTTFFIRLPIEAPLEGDALAA